MNSGQIELGCEVLRTGFDRNIGDPVADQQYLVTFMMSPAATKRQLLEAHKEWARRHEIVPKRPMYWDANRVSRHGKIRVGYVCHFFGATTMSAVAQLMRDHDHDHFEIFAYDDSAEGAEGARTADHWRKTGGLTNAEFAKTVCNDGIDILVEINGMIPGNRYGALMLRPAPIQVNWGNYPCTLGMKCLEFSFADPITVPAEDRKFYVERIMMLDYQSIAMSYEDIDFPVPVEPPVLKNGYPTFGCFGALHKYNSRVAENWANVLNSIPESRLLIKSAGVEHQMYRDNIIHLFKNAGVDESMIEIRPPSPYTEMLTEYADIDIVLDTFPMTGGSTVCESIWSGLPALSVRGNRWSSRQGASILQSAGLEDFIAEEPAQLVEIAKSLLDDVESMRDRRLGQRENISKSAFADRKKTVMQFENIFKQLVEEKRNQGETLERLKYTLGRNFGRTLGNR